VKVGLLHRRTAIKDDRDAFGEKSRDGFEVTDEMLARAGQVRFHLRGIPIQETVAIDDEPIGLHERLTALGGGPNRAGRFPLHQFNGQQFAALGDLFAEKSQHPVAGQRAELVQVVTNGRQPRRDEGRFRNVVDAHDRDVLGNAQALFHDISHGADGHAVVARHDGREVLILREQLSGRFKTVFLAPIPAAVDPGKIAFLQAAALAALDERLPEFDARVRVGSCNNADVMMTQGRQVIRRLERRSPIIDGNKIQRAVRKIMIHQQEGERMALECLEIGVVNGRGNEEHAVDALGFKQVEIFLALDKFRIRHIQNDFVILLRGPVVDAADDFAKVNVGKDVVQMGNDHAKRFAGTRSQTAGIDVRLVAVLLDHAQYLRARFLADSRIVVKNQGNGAQGDAAFSRNIFYSCSWHSLYVFD